MSYSSNKLQNEVYIIFILRRKKESQHAARHEAPTNTSLSTSLDDAIRQTRFQGWGDECTELSQCHRVGKFIQREKACFSNSSLGNKDFPHQSRLRASQPLLVLIF